METQATPTAPSVEQLTSRLADNRKAQGEVTTHRDEHQGQTRILADKIDSASTLVASAQQIFTDDPTPTNRASLASARESHRKLTLAKQKHLDEAPDDSAISEDLTSLQLAERKLVVKLRSHRLATLREEYNTLMEDMRVLIPRCVAMGYHLSSLMPGSTDPYQHLKVVVPGLMNRIDAEWLKLKGDLDGR